MVVTRPGRLKRKKSPRRELVLLAADAEPPTIPTLPYLPDDVCYEIVSWLGITVSFDCSHLDDHSSQYYNSINDDDLFTAAQLSSGFFFHAKKRRAQLIQEDKKNKELRLKVQFYCEDPENCVKEHGPIEDWDTSMITSMTYLFGLTEYEMDQEGVWDVDEEEEVYWNSFFNADISRWDTSNVRDMSFMFFEAR